MKCPHCDGNIDVRFIKAPGNGQPKQESAPTGDLGELLGRINDEDLDEKALEFVTQTRERYEKYQDRTRMSEKQMAWLTKIAEGEGRRDDWS